MAIAMAVGKREHECSNVLGIQPIIYGCELRGSTVVSISACHTEDPGSIPGRGESSKSGLHARGVWVVGSDFRLTHFNR